MLQGLSLTLPLAGCLLTGDKPEPGLDIPPAYSAGPRNPVAAEAAIPPLDWWRSFRSRELTELIEEARSSNLDIAVAVAQIVQADAQARIAGAALLPIIDFNANGQHSQQSKTTGSSSLINVSRSGPSVAIINNNLSATLNASYEIDFWGKNRSLVRADAQARITGAALLPSRSQRQRPALAAIQDHRKFEPYQCLPVGPHVAIINNNLGHA